MSKSHLTYFFYKLINRPHLVLGSVCLLILGFLVLTPLLEIIRDSLSVQSYDIAYLPEAKIGEFTLFHYDRVFVGPLSKALLINPLLNSIAIGVCVTLIGVSIGTLLAWLIVKTNIRYKSFFGALARQPPKYYILLVVSDLSLCSLLYYVAFLAAAPARARTLKSLRDGQG